ncbi:MAG: MATE family efflux transporter, partial [Anaerolineales bacterium]|nr:MATE family efflux transporter [Anaerolineales bacterium]
MNQVWSKTRQWISVIRLTPFGADTEEESSKERLRRVALTAMVSAFAQGVSMLTVLVSVPLTLNYLGAERYGLWIAISSFIAILGFADLGMGNGLLNALAGANGRDDHEAAKSYVSSAFYILTGIALFFGVIWTIVYPHISWAWLFNVATPEAAVEAGPAVSIFIWCMLVNLPVGLVQKIYDGYQEGYINGLWRAGSSLLGLCNVLIAIYFRANLPWLVLAMAGSPVLVMTFSATTLFGVRRPWLLPKWRMVNQSASKQILKSGSLFFILQLVVAVAYQSDNLVIARFLGASQVPQYAVPMKLFTLIPSLLSFVLTPLWPAYGEAFARKDINWIRKTFKRSLLLSFSASLPPSLFLVFFGGKVIEIWVGPEIHPAFVLLMGLCLWTVLLSLASPISVLLNGINKIGFQTNCSIFMAIGNLFFSILLVQK